MDPRRRALAMVAIFVGLLAFHLWLLYRTVSGQSWFLAALIAIAITLFGWRIHHYAIGYRRAVRGEEDKTPAEELRQIRTMTPVLVGLLALHGWLITVVLPTRDYAFVALLLAAVTVFVLRLGHYARRYRQIRGGNAG